MKQQTIPLAKAKATLSELVRNIRKSRKSVILTVDGIPAVELRPAPKILASPLSDDEVRLVESLASTLQSIPAVPNEKPWDAVEIIADGRR
jgi:hypothetical protein